MSQIDTKESLLDAAERLFAADGFANASLRSITGTAGANLAAVNYHFGSKEALLEAVIDRRLVPLNHLRSERLAAVGARARSGGAKPEVRLVLQAFIEPTLQFRESCPGAGAFVTLVGRALAEPDDTVRRLFLRRMEPLFLQLLKLLREALPDVSEEILLWRLHFTMGAIGHTLCWVGRLAAEPPLGRALPTDAGSVTAMLLDFLTSGLEGARP